MQNISVRGLDEAVLKALKQRAAAESVSLNSLVVRTLTTAVGGSPVRPLEHHDLDHLFGVWSEADAQEFAANTANFREVDSSMWGEPPAAVRSAA
jgi:plasmid stability protein